MKIRVCGCNCIMCDRGEHEHCERASEGICFLTKYTGPMFGPNASVGPPPEEATMTINSLRGQQHNYPVRPS
jgi:hypothetical protein